METELPEQSAAERDREILFNGGLSGGGDQDVDQSLRYHINILNAMETEGFEIVNREQQMAWARCYDLAKREMKDQVMSVLRFRRNR